MKWVFAIFFIGVLSLRSALPFIEYALNYNYISTVLCVNKNRPEKNCDGKCHLEKQLAKTQDHSPENTMVHYKFIELIAINHTLNWASVKTVIQKSMNDRFYYHNSYAFYWHSVIIKPPIA